MNLSGWTLLMKGEAAVVDFAALGALPWEAEAILAHLILAFRLFLQRPLLPHWWHHSSRFLSSF